MSTIKLRRDTAANWLAANPVLSLAEPGLETDTNKVKYGDGVHHWSELSYAGGASGTIWTNNANGCLRVELSNTGFQAFTDGSHLDLQDGGQWNVGSYQNKTSIGNDGFANPADLWLRAGDAVYLTTDLNTVSDGNSWLFSNNVLQTNGKAKIDFWKDNSRLGAPAPLGTTDTLTLWNFNNENPVGQGYNYAIGVEGNHVWFATDTDPTTADGGFKFYSRGQETLKIGSDGSFVKNDGFTFNAGAHGSLTLGTFIEVPGVDEHFHIAFPNSNIEVPYQDLFLGNDWNNVKIRGSHSGPFLGVDIRANAEGFGNAEWHFNPDGTTIFPNNNTLDAGTQRLSINAGYYIEINSDYYSLMQWTNPDVDPTVPGTMFGSGFVAGDSGFTDSPGPAMFIEFTPDGNEINEAQSTWFINNQGNLETLIYQIDVQTETLSYDTADIVDRFGNSIIHPVAGDAPPEGSKNGRLWFNSDEARLYIMYNSQWIDASPTILPPPLDAPSALVNGDLTVSIQADGSLMFANGTGIGNLQQSFGGTAWGIDLKSYNNNGYSQLNWNDTNFAWANTDGVFLQTSNQNGVIGQVKLNTSGYLEINNGFSDPMILGEISDGDMVVWAPEIEGEGYLGLWLGGNRDLGVINSMNTNYGPNVSVNVGAPLEDGEYSGDPYTPEGYLVHVNVRGANWYFREDAGLQFPDGSVQTTAAVVDGGDAYSSLLPV